MKNKDTNKAVAITYDQNHGRAPKVVARGRGHLADKIVAIARQHNVPLQRDSNLAGVLELLEPGTEIPPELYYAVAEVLAFVYRMNRKYTPSCNSST
jgi:flagellar biosynthesis protein